ncbi:gamma-glutamylcyclotransferase [Bradyrhizobium sp. SYSU BS000235]|uniref:gamma-glutamylcyclotransferase n=1 Tax=Bradyrhizobium sp. SYSU BS000235 TaxID=3411332 RepID=UPI003C7265AD
MAAKVLSDAEFPDGDLWVFGYGSLIWNPGFEFLDKKPARLIGEHRSLCIYSMVHRGTPEKPGLVLGLDRGGACQGVAFRVAPDKRHATIRYLREREQATHVYREVLRSVWVEGDARQRVSALAYVADRSHDQYAGRLSPEEQLRLVRQGHGNYGPNDEYIIATVAALEAQGIRDVPLHQLAAKLHGEATLHRHASDEQSLG